MNKNKKYFFIVIYFFGKTDQKGQKTLNIVKLTPHF